MRKIILSASLILSLILTGFSQEKKVALVTFYGDKKIGGTGMSTIGESLMKDPNFNLQPLVDKAYERFVNEFAKDFPFKLIDQNEISSNPDYQNFKSSMLADTSSGFNKSMGIQYAMVKGMIWAYGDIQGLLKEEKRDPCNLAKIFPQADGILFVTMDYEFKGRSMGFAAGAVAYLNMFLYDKKCDKVFRIREFGESKGKVPAVGNIPIMDVNKIQPLCQDATDALFEELKGKLGKIVKKSAKF
ncbi:hypothetical protein SAMN04488109_4712 [Chryseolinea serpens]|uniref:Uncharacterized protein n=1 Tax=Chryseolinea serpens TaxID=947013 RepID=A0A1M5UI40_9BACT|nr:hypothetical protein [Chryseolinea serpens]SHH62694.1 hypothetical protein SAMN04488109_4712 [Chryseolinea serpens]